MTNDTPTSTTTAAVGGSSSGTIDDDTVGSPPTSSGQATTIHIPRSIAHSEVAVTRHKRLQKTKLCKYGEDCAYRAIGRCFYAHSIEEVQPRPPKTEEEIAAEQAETIRNIAMQEQAAAMLATNPWCNPQIAATLAATMGGGGGGLPGMPGPYGATAYWAALLAQAATAGDLARAAGAATLPSPQLMAPDVMAATMDSGLIPGLSGLPVAGSLDFALLGLQGGEGLFPPPVGGNAPPPMINNNNTPSTLLLTKPPGLARPGETPDASSKAPSVDGLDVDTRSGNNNHDGLETRSVFGGTRDLSSLGVIGMTNVSKSN
ncbi:hypothetical protein Pmar_PMAR028999 [Perkinsus marinus ATCC 50983]|uniref:C3H1-type domain-containing protein n=1 Tax=Perkinsus marinus (strain ATCC 50983 / TXsc) TaxID=423536 RepID=C5L683_PERM5|nr:hypothetical protein Pmar_PMAR028999 [Perkinsus marinus ATCC 50983]EER07710.1 hypothetical protein Pmar_PMAR028999 [Perkinsus marinus ATCC 50983]|eukprot:XP_002775894.1 hypothetical protein Pmar_PMAR028999 [Perkinsus marinus ATCC 50983]